MRSDERRARSVASAYWDAACSGRFFSRWSAIVSFVVATTLLVPVVAGGSIAEYAHGMLAATIGWSLLAVAALGASVAERRMPGRTARGILITLTLLGMAIARPFINEAALLVLFGERSTGVWPSRIATNIVVVVLLFSLVAVITTQHQQTRATAKRLTTALARLDAAMARVTDDERSSLELIRDIVAKLRAARDAMLAGRIDFEAVRGFSERVRAASHRLSELAAVAAPLPAPTTTTLVTTQPRGLDRLAPTPRLWVAVTYTLTCLPFLASTTGLAVTAVSLLGLIVVDLGVGFVIRAVAARTPSARGVVFLIAWGIAGALAAALGSVLMPGVGLLVLVPLVGLPLTAVVLATAIDARRRAVAEERRSTKALARAAGDLADRTVQAREPLHHAASTLHGRVQGRCVIFAAFVDENTPAASDIARFRAETDAALDEVLMPVAPAAPAPERDGGLQRMLTGWEALMRLETRIDSGAAEILAAPESGSQITEVVNEALVNAVKHSGARTARIDVAVGDHDAVHVRVASPGRLPQPVVTSRQFAERVLLYQDGSDVVLESIVTAPVAVTV